jgi:predicted 2-oxoglutarate/Fe(II)-dependent dioxygenase YbiX
METNFRYIENNFLTPQECLEYIRISEDHGYEEALIQVGGGRQEMNKDVRDNFRVVLDSPELATNIWNKVKHLAPLEEGWEAIGLNERMRFYRYEFGQQFKRHVDGPFRRNENEVSKVTVLLYLNDDFSGGTTQFFDPFQIVTPEAGQLLLFKHRQLHQGDPVTTGRKYVLRSDIMYKKVNI